MAFESLRAIAFGLTLTTVATGGLTWVLRDEISKPVSINPRPIPTRTEPARASTPTPIHIPLGVKLTAGNRYPDPEITPTSMIAYTVTPRSLSQDPKVPQTFSTRTKSPELFPRATPTATTTLVVSDLPGPDIPYQ